MDDYSKSGLKSARAAAKQREREMTEQMAVLLAERDEQALIGLLKSRYNLTPKDPRYTELMQIWRDAQRRLQSGLAAVTLRSRSSSLHPCSSKCSSSNLAILVAASWMISV